jgi:hypothetical protein
MPAGARAVDPVTAPRNCPNCAASRSSIHGRGPNRVFLYRIRQTAEEAIHNASDHQTTWRHRVCRQRADHRASFWQQLRLSEATRTAGRHFYLAPTRPCRADISNGLRPRPCGLFWMICRFTSARIFPQRGCKLNEPNGFEPLWRVHDRIIRGLWPINFAHKRQRVRS